MTLFCKTNFIAKYIKINIEFVLFIIINLFDLNEK